MEGNTLSLRPLNLPADWPFLAELLAQYKGRRQECEEINNDLQNAFMTMFYSRFGRSFMCLLNNSPVAVIDIFQAVGSDMFPATSYQPGDYGINLLIAPPIELRKQLLARILYGCLEYLFAFQDIDRIIIQTDPGNEHVERILLTIGFKFITIAQQQLYKTNIYGCTRQDLLVDIRSAKRQIMNLKLVQQD